MSDTKRSGALKLVVAGGYGAGKTTLVTTLSDITPICTESGISSFGDRLDPERSVTKTATTVAFDFGRYAVAPDLMAYLFGLPGQDRFRFLWPTLAQGSFGALVVVDPDRCDDARISLAATRQLGIPAVVVVNAFNGLMTSDIDSVYDTVIDTGRERILTVDVRDPLAAREAVRSLLQFAATERGFVAGSPDRNARTPHQAAHAIAG